MINKMVKSLGFLAFAVFLFLLDQLTKRAAFSESPESSGAFEFLNSLRPVLGKQLFENDAFAFSLPMHGPAVYIIYALLLALLIIWFIFTKNKSTKIYLGFLLILVGALSNIFDRITLGFVRDFIYIFWGNIFNLADIYIVLGIILMIL